MTITIPTWALWALGIVIGVPALIAIIALAWFGYVVLASLAKGGMWK